MPDSPSISSEVSTDQFNIQTIPGKTISRVFRGPELQGMFGDQGSSMVPGNKAEFGAFLFTTPCSWTLQSPYGDKAPQTITLRTNQTYYVYHEVGGGVDDFYVVYAEDAVWSPGGLVHPGGGSVGIFLGMFKTKVFPTLDLNSKTPATNGVNWVASSPLTVNQTVQTQHMVVTSSSVSVTAEVSENPSMSVTASTGTQVWNSQTYPISDWGVLEQTDGAANTPAWTYHQQELFDPTVQTPGTFASWWNSVYAGDNVKMPPALSMSSLQYQTNATWRFQRRLAQGGKLPVSFIHDISFSLFEIANPKQAGTNGHHKLAAWNGDWQWSNTVDLASIINIVK